PERPEPSPNDPGGEAAPTGHPTTDGDRR
ncbi:YbjN domain-containing protein, partial [Burkholderia multivorans]